MNVLTITDVRKNLSKVVDAAIDGEAPTIIARPGGKAAIIVALDEWEGMKATLYLLGNKSNAKRLIESLEQIERGDTHEYARPELDEKDQDANAA